MQITVHVDGFYDWEPLPKDAQEPSKADIDARRVKPDSSGNGWLMKVSKKGATHTTISLPEHQLIAAIIDEMTRGDHKVLTRREAVARYLSRHVMPHHAHRNWMREVEVDDGDGTGDPALFDQMVQQQVAAGNLQAEDVEALKAAYAEKSTADEQCNHLHGHFGIKNHAEHKAKRHERRRKERLAAAPGEATEKKEDPQ